MWNNTYNNAAIDDNKDPESNNYKNVRYHQDQVVLEVSQDDFNSDLNLRHKIVSILEHSTVLHVSNNDRSGSETDPYDVGLSE